LGWNYGSQKTKLSRSYQKTKIKINHTTSNYAVKTLKVSSFVKSIFITPLTHWMSQ